MKTKITVLIIPLCMALSSTSNARVTTLTGGVSTGYDYFDRSYETETEVDDTVTTSSSRDDDHSRFFISPYIIVLSETPRDSAEIQYAPSFRWDLDESDDDVDHKFSLDYQRELTKRWSFTLSDNYIDTDEFNSYQPEVDSETGGIISERPGESTATGDSLQDDSGRRSYYTNKLQVGTSYTYFEDSVVALDYSWDILRNDESDSGSNYQDYDKHNVGLTLGHRINSKWRTTAEVGMIRGLYDSVDSQDADTESVDLAESDDVDEYRASLRVDHELSYNHSLNATYGYNEADYEAELRLDSEIHDITLGWAWLISPQLNMELGAGPTYTKRDGESGDWNYNGNFSMNYRFEKGSFSISAAGGEEFENFSGTEKRGNTEFFQFQADLIYALMERTSVSVYASFRSEDRDELADTESNQLILNEILSGETVTDPLDVITVNTERYSAGCSLSYQLYENYVAEISYGYVRQDSEVDTDDYEDHSFIVSLSYENDFFRW